MAEEGKTLVLVVADEPRSMKLFRGLPQMGEHTTLEATDGEECSGGEKGTDRQW
ncbi:MAG: hypothetical protein HN742_29725 [Lentisphaerae bacterium]|jgi:hypothetical protein|nr:hypothetical protein [Lentisphaerota bacterium]MBT4823012.1 hypothetical protein [Lentisphaerota bacterium]MBT5612771.1 hypothetical protein [Lentisphaerota bacterium]MBT7053987.1 hypothetical protein [Lentisphaerota bacterium]MBT7846088.1 hypothetical protein [Lentisphaerota bacterium]